MSIPLLRTIAKFSYLILLIYIPIWLYIIPSDFSLPMAILFWWVPLLPPVIGIIKGKYYTMSWASFLVTIPFCHGVMTWLANLEESRWGMAELLLTVIYFASFLTMAKKMKRLAMDEEANSEESARQS